MFHSRARDHSIRLIFKVLPLLLGAATVVVSSCRGVVMQSASGQLVLPDLPTPLRPNPEPAYPSGWDTFAPPVQQTTANANAPAIGEWTRTGNPNDNLVLTGQRLSTASGSDAGADTEFVVYGQTNSNDGARSDASILMLDGAKAAITLPTGQPQTAMYLLWPVNSSGAGYPVAVNRTDAWWIGPDQAAAGDTVSIYGRNLSQNGTSGSWVYLKLPQVAGIWAPVTSVNPYRVQFTVPSALAPGSYEVWVHNGHGGKYGWSSPLSLTIAAGYSWNGAAFNVQTYGARGDGVTDDSNAIQAACVAACQYRDSSGLHPTIYFPAGTYMVRYGFGLDHDLRFLGDGSTKTFLKCNASFSQPGAAGDGYKLGILFGNGGPQHNVEIRGLTLDANGNFNVTNDGGYVLNCPWLGCSDFLMDDVKIVAASGIDCAKFTEPYRLTVENCEFDGGELFLLQGHQEQIDGCAFVQSNFQESAVHELHNSEFSITRSEACDADASQKSGQGQGRLLVGSAWFGAQHDAYIADNTTIALGPTPGDNMGEQVLCEGATNYNAGTPSSATADTVYFASLDAAPSDYTGQTAVICSGTGVGQYRAIVGFDASSNTMKVSPAWNVVPDSTSRILIESGTSHWVVYHNTLQGKSFYASAYSAMAGIELYGGCYEWIGDGNSISQMRTGICVGVPGQAAPLTSVEPCFFNLFSSNSIASSYSGFSTISAIPDGVLDPGLSMLGNVFRGNTVSGMASVGASQYTDVPATTPATPLDVTLIEHNTFSGSPTGFDADPGGRGTRTRNTVLYENAFADGASSTGMHFGAQTGQYVLRGNTFQDSEAPYGPLSASTNVGLPIRTIRVTSASAQLVSGQLSVWNCGTLPLSWTGFTDSNWLKLSASAGSVNDQNSSANLSVNCDGAGLSPGRYLGRVSIASGSQAQTLYVIYDVTSSARAARTPLEGLQQSRLSGSHLGHSRQLLTP